MQFCSNKDGVWLISCFYQDCVWNFVLILAFLLSSSGKDITLHLSNRCAECCSSVFTPVCFMPFGDKKLFVEEMSVWESHKVYVIQTVSVCLLLQTAAGSITLIKCISWNVPFFLHFLWVFGISKLTNSFLLPSKGEHHPMIACFWMWTSLCLLY